MLKQVKLYNINLGMVKTQKERQLSKLRNHAYNKMINYKNELSTIIKDSLGEDNWTKECGIILKEKLKEDVIFKLYEKEYNKFQELLHDEYISNNIITRGINSKNIKDTNTIAIGSNNLTRTLEIDLGTFTDKFIEIECGKIDDLVIEQVVKTGLYIDNDFYIFFTAGAGQTRQSKFMMIREDVWKDKGQALMCGLTIEQMNELGGMNISKWLAYLALNNSTSRILEVFNIDKCIVVDDFETMVAGTVDYIDRQDKVENGTKTYTIKKGKFEGQERTKKNYKVEWKIEPNKEMLVPVPHMDGCGVMLTSVNKKNIQFRMPWFKGLLTPTNLKKYATEVAKNTKIKDIYGKEYDIIKDDIRILFTKSQFKLWSYYKNEVDENGNDILDESGNIKYSGWDRYKDNFKTYNCTFNICEEDEKEYKDVQLNYQMLQTLTDINDEQIKILTKDFKELIDKVHTDRESMLKFLEATKEDNNRDYFQEILRLYPEMCNSDYVKEQISQKIKSAKKEAMSGKLVIPNTKRMFLIPDIVAFMDWLFTGNENPKGYLKENEVYCNLYKGIDKVDILRSPHLSFEHSIRNNVATDINKCEYFTTNGMYTSTHDLITKIIQADTDGDHVTVISENWVIKLVENMIEKYNINPIYYEMGKAGANEINNDNIFKSLQFVYHKANIGKVSNALMKIWNGENPWAVYDISKKLCAYNNDVIDSAKTLLIKKLPKDLTEKFAKLNKEKYPYFFQFAKKEIKDKDCREIGNSVMDRICQEIKSISKTNYSFKKGFGVFEVKKLMNKQRNFDIDYDIIKFYLQLEKQTREKIGEYATICSDKDDDKNNSGYKYQCYAEAREKVLNYAKEKGIKYEFVVDNIIKYSFEDDSLKMAFVFEVFGAVIINNLNKNIKESVDKGYILCECCGKRVKNTNGKTKRCKECAEKVNKKKTNENKKKKKAS
ncbi:hypothetical protein OD350_24810 [Clostridium beijerinckii]|uniref:Uncharacterized protein n=1 Tax=Clostridium beijerinckii TaxID=1520 RepID=A0AAX0B540_CLOBE|nr:hypothetical protein [Clostridium beijerinckii]NRT90202.1 hypothetical protein [Clostridium beijerinckii]NYC69732.1 hypothetical protein [Clostridium beijerinckii]UYZ35393.1 hypothetical protein OD350_24810 [Clostridium beijerinckii]